MKPLFVFDLDGTITNREILPHIAQELGIAEEIALLTQLTLNGSIGFEASFRLRFQLLRHIPVSKVRAMVSAVPLNPHIAGFIRANPEQCAVLTGNLDRWIEPLLDDLGCAYRSSTSSFCNGELVLCNVLDKGKAIRELAADGHPLIAIGESVNDLPMFARADIGIAYGGVHYPVPELCRLAHYAAFSGQTLVRLLQTLLRQPQTPVPPCLADSATCRPALMRGTTQA